MIAEIISSGTELLLGHTINTDAAHIARELAGLGISVYHIHTVGDNAQRLEATISEALSGSDLVIVSGGLGPTPDDLTREAAARISGKNLVSDPTTLRKLHTYFKGRPMSANQQKQAMFPEGAHIFANREGTAPGFAMEIGSKILILLPGPPRELVPMLEKEVRPWLQARSTGIILSRMIRAYGIGEGEAAEKLGSLLDGANPTIATYADDWEMHVKITARADNLESAEKLLDPAMKQALIKLENYAYGYDSDSLASRTVGLLAEKKLLVATAESCTGGWLAQQITSCPGSSAIFHLGIVSYANSAKEKMLSVPGEILEKFGAVSMETAEYMAKGIRKLAKSNLGISITGIAGPDGATKHKPLGLVYFCLYDGEHCFFSQLAPGKTWPGRDRVRMHAVKTALDMIRRYLSCLDIPEKY